MSRSRRVLFSALTLAIALAGCKWTGFADPANPPVVAKATDWIKTQQQANGSFEVAGFPGFETPDVVVALGERGQTSGTWDPAKALAAVTAAKTDGKSALDALDDFADGTLAAGQAAKLIVLVAAPLGLDPLAFDPQSDGARNLVVALDAGVKADGSYGAFNATLYAALAKRLTTGGVPAKTLTVIKNAQEASGGWDFAGSPTGTDADVDTTALAAQALVAGKVTKTNGYLVRGLRYLAERQRSVGAWQSFGSNDPNSTSTAVLAITAAGFDPNTPCWRNTVSPAQRGNPYHSPVNWLRTQQAADGHITSPNDSFPPVNTFGTSQSVQALERGWLPVAWLDARTC